MKNISILGCTGSIGVQVLEVIRNLKSYKVLGLTANDNIDLLIKQIIEFKPIKVAVMKEEVYEKLNKMVLNLQLDYELDVLLGMEGLIEVATIKEVDIVLNSLVGNIGLKPTVAAINNCKDIALANKETLVTGGELVMDIAKKNNVNVYPVDSEHSAIFQCLQDGANNNIETIYLTASGGPFRDKSLEELKYVTIEKALKHPNWVMGSKITIDSATMMNKGLEVIEAKWLFDIELEKIKILIHPQSIIHSMVEFEDGAIISQLGVPDMKVPIQYALTYPKRVKNSYKRLNFTDINELNFSVPDFKKFKCLELAYEAIKIGGTMPTALNAANEIAVNKFLNEEINFLNISDIIEKTIKAFNVKYDLTLESILEADEWARNYANEIG